MQVGAVMAGSLYAIPHWNYDGVLPPNDADNPTSAIRSPYAVSLFELVDRFGNTEHCRGLLRGLLSFRAELHKAGLNQGFQWINGSFLENDEARNGRPPNDIDVVTFFYIPDGYTGETLAYNISSLLDSSNLKNNYAVDAYYVPLNHTTPEETVNQSAYWYSLWSHTRNGEWKGYLQIDLAGDDDQQARLQLDQLGSYEGGQV